MIVDWIYVVTAILLVGIGQYALIVRRHIFRKLMAINIMGTGIFVLFIGLTASPDGADPVPQAMVLTGIVVAVSATALGLVLARKIQGVTGCARLSDPTTPSPDAEEGL